MRKVDPDWRSVKQGDLGGITLYHMRTTSEGDSCMRDPDHEQDVSGYTASLSDVGARHLR
jgi:hypothetical protein